MKKILIAGILNLATFVAVLPTSAKSAAVVPLADTPAAVKAAIARLYPAARNVKF